MSRQVQTCLAKICQNVSLSIFRQVLTCPGKYKHVYLQNPVNCHQFAMFLTSSGNFGQVPTSFNMFRQYNCIFLSFSKLKFKFHKLIQTTLDKERERRGKGNEKGRESESKKEKERRRKGKGKKSKKKEVKEKRKEKKRN